MKVRINNKEVDLNIQGEKSYGGSNVLLNSDDDLTQHTVWKNKGFSVEPFLADELFKEFDRGIKEFFKKNLAEVCGVIPGNFQVEDYHKIINNNQALHLEFIKRSTQLSYDFFPIRNTEVVDRISDILKIPLTVKNPYNNYERFHLRTVRPHSQDFNPLHRDAWLDRLRNGINLYIPIAASTDLSSLCVIPGSHYWEESKIERTLGGAIVNNVSYNVPALTDAKIDFTILRPNPGYNEVLVFSPYLIHGGAANFNEDQTRISLEMRLWRK